MTASSVRVRKAWIRSREPSLAGRLRASFRGHQAGGGGIPLYKNLSLTPHPLGELAGCTPVAISSPLPPPDGTPGRNGLARREGGRKAGGGAPPLQKPSLAIKAAGERHPWPRQPPVCGGVRREPEHSSHAQRRRQQANPTLPPEQWKEFPQASSQTFQD